MRSTIERGLKKLDGISSPSDTELCPVRAAFGRAWLYAADQLEGGGHPIRDGQFGHIIGQVAELFVAGQPVIFVDTKKKVLIGS